ncbi:hypothetical protein SAMN05443549_10983 [Flavobacterium fluvii]|uniref:Uncharacterized protein n=1 Tax=Flavobacterium fluvii TaxID=468056 RepID=A0A1M5P6J4_9FLAO|nr:hypothetical protein [Flavobacterium fluvii]SHG97378.1 hypothetical protein SAMN05443549_10983 [Flavobacterium fluvii]
MNTSKIIATLLILASFGVGYLGYNKIAESTNEVNLLGLKIEASDESGKQEGYLFLGLAAILFFGGIYTLNKSKN